MSVTLETKRAMKYHNFLPVLQKPGKRKEELRLAVQKEAQAGQTFAHKNWDRTRTLAEPTPFLCPSALKTEH